MQMLKPPSWMRRDMIKTVTEITLILITITLSSLGAGVLACTCSAPRSPYAEYQDAKAVFVGKVISSKDIATTENIRGKTYTAYERVYQLSVNESLKGLKKSQVEINVGRIDSTCYQGFVIGESYLVYAFGDSDSSLRSGACGRTNNLSHAGDELHYLRDLMNGIPEPRVYGSVMRVDANLGGNEARIRVTPMSGIRVLIEGKGKSFEAVTNGQGLYSFAKMPDGKYKARPLLPKKYMTYFPAEEEFVLGPQEVMPYERIQQGSAAYASFRIGWSNHLNGRIVDSEGNAIVRAKVAVLLSRDPSPVVVEQDEYDLHDEGKFQFSGLTPGRYLLAVDIRAPFADKNRATRFYYPNSVSLVQADEIAISESETLEDRDIRLPPEYVVRQVEGVLVWPNGVPVSGGWVFLAPSKNSPDDEKKYDSRITDALGRFSLQAFVGAEYWVHGESNSSGKGEPVKIKVEKNNEPLKVIIPFPKRVER
jgi:hypothetical protein